jgi:hypothetical protein
VVPLSTAPARRCNESAAYRFRTGPSLSRFGTRATVRSRTISHLGISPCKRFNAVAGS